MKGTLPIRFYLKLLYCIIPALTYGCEAEKLIVTRQSEWEKMNVKDNSRNNWDIKSDQRERNGKSLCRFKMAVADEDNDDVHVSLAILFTARLVSAAKWPYLHVMIVVKKRLVGRRF